MEIGDTVIKDAGDYTFAGVILPSLKKLSGAERYVVENPDGIVHIFSEKNIRILSCVRTN